MSIIYNHNIKFECMNRHHLENWKNILIDKIKYLKIINYIQSINIKNK